MLAPLTGTAYSYLRFSSLQQDQAESIRRQTAARDAWLAKNPSVVLDKLTLADLGVSGFRGKNQTDDKAALAQFIRAVETGRVKPGSFLVVESLDRITRQELGEAFELLLGLVNRGVRIVPLSHPDAILEKPVNMTAIMLAVVELSRANSESVTKSNRIGSKWAAKRAAVRDEGAIFTARMKAWCEVANEKIVFKPGAKALLRRMFKLATAGHGCRSIVRKLVEEKVPTWTGRAWSAMYVRSILHGREVLGELQQCRRLPSGRRQPEGKPVKNYYPAAVTEAEWLAVQTAMKARVGKGRGPSGTDFVGVFRGLLRDAKSGESLHVFPSRNGRVLKPEGQHQQGRGGSTQFPYDVFERAVLDWLSELDARELFDTSDAPDDVAELSAKLARLDAQLKSLTDNFDDDDVIPEVAAKVKQKNAERKTTVESLDRAKASAASPLSAAWGETRGLVESLDAAKDKNELRVRLRQVIARTVESVRAMFVRRDGILVAGVQLRFVGSDHTRDYVVWYHSYSKRCGVLGGTSDAKTDPALAAELNAIRADQLALANEVFKAHPKKELRAAASDVLRREDPKARPEPAFDFRDPAQAPAIEAVLKVYAEFFHRAHGTHRPDQTRWTPERGGWTPEEVALFDTHTNAQIVAATGRGAISVQGKRQHLRLLAKRSAR